MNKSLLFIFPFLAFSLCDSSVQAQNFKELYKEADSFGQRLPAFIDKEIQQIEWAADTVYWYKLKTKKGITYLYGSIDSSKDDDLMDLTLITQELNRIFNKKFKEGELPISHIKFFPHEQKVEFKCENQTFHYNQKEKKITPITASAQAPYVDNNIFINKNEDYWFFEQADERVSISPDKKTEAFIRNHNLFTRDVASKQETQRTTNGTAEAYYSANIQWSPDSQKIVCNLFTPGEARYVPIVESSPKDQLQPKLQKHLYAKPGDKLCIRKPTLINLQTNTITQPEFPDADNQFSLYGNEISWSGDSSYFTFIYNQRGHKKFIYYKVPVDNAAKAQPIATEEAKTFVWYGPIYRQRLEQTNELLWTSQRDGWMHLYLIDIQTGKVKSQLTQGEWNVKQIFHVDTEQRYVHFVGIGKDKGQNPYLEKLYRLHLDTKELVEITPDNAHHVGIYSSGYKYVITASSRVDMPTKHILREVSSGKIIKEINQVDPSALKKAGYPTPEPFCAAGRDGKTDIWGVIFRPKNFQKNKKYPIIEYIYAGPHGAVVPHTFRPMYWEATLTELGFIVVVIDGMGTAHRSKAFHDVCYKNIKDAGFPDRIAWMKAAAKKYPELDISRVGIYGMSAGGQNAMGAVLFHPEFYKAAVAACGCHDNRMDKIWWNEQWMGYPIDESYKDNSNMTHAAKLQGKLMLILGEVDSNVDPSSTVQVVNELVKANKEFDYVLIPNANHTMGEKYGERKRRDFFIKHLMGKNPPEWNDNP